MPLVAKTREFGIAEPERFVFEIGAGTQTRDPFMIASWLRGLRFNRRFDKRADFILFEPLNANMPIDMPGAAFGIVVVLREVASAADGAEIEGCGGEVVGDAVLGEGVEEGGGGAVEGLTVVAEDGGDGAEEEEEGEVGEGVVQVPGAGDFWSEDGGVVGVS